MPNDAFLDGIYIIAIVVWNYDTEESTIIVQCFLILEDIPEFCLSRCQVGV